MLIKRFVIILALVLVCSSCQAAEMEDLTIYNKAQQLIDEYNGDASKLYEAGNLLKKIAIKNPNSEYALVGMGRLMYKLGYINSNSHEPESVEQAIVLFEKAIAINPHFFDAYIYGAYPYITSKNYPKVRQMIKEAEKIQPNSPKVDGLYASLAEDEKNYDQAMKYAKSALSKKPDKRTFINSHQILTTVYKYRKEYNLAENSYLAVIQIDPNSPWAKSNYSSFLTNYKHDYNKAIEQGEAALKLMDFGMGHTILGKAYYEKAAQLHWTEKQYEASKKYFLLSIEHSPYNANAYYGLGMTYYQTGYQNKNKAEIIKAEESLIKAVQIDPNHRQAIEQLGNVRKLIEFLGR